MRRLLVAVVVGVGWRQDEGLPLDLVAREATRLELVYDVKLFNLLTLIVDLHSRLSTCFTDQGQLRFVIVLADVGVAGFVGQLRAKLALAALGGVRVLGSQGLGQVVLLVADQVLNELASLLAIKQVSLRDWKVAHQRR